MNINGWAARGFAVGTASHRIGTARALQVNELSGAFSGLAIGLNALATSIIWPVVMHLKNIYKDQEHVEDSTTKKFLVVQTEGKRQVERQLKHFNLDTIV